MSQTSTSESASSVELVRGGDAGAAWSDGCEVRGAMPSPPKTMSFEPCATAA